MLEKFICRFVTLKCRFVTNPLHFFDIYAIIYVEKRCLRILPCECLHERRLKKYFGGKSMKTRRLLSLLLSVLMILSMLPTGVLAQSTESSDAVFQGLSEAVLAVQELIDALPTPEDVTEEDYDAVESAYDAFLALSQEQQAQITGAEVFESLFEFFNAQIETLESDPNDGDASTTYYYLKADGTKASVSSDDCEVITQSTRKLVGGKCYVASGLCTIEAALELVPDDNDADDILLILLDGAKLEVVYDISDGYDYPRKLTITAGAETEQIAGTGTLSTGLAGYRDDEPGLKSGFLTVNGGVVYAYGASGGIGIFSVDYTQNGGVVHAIGSDESNVYSSESFPAGAGIYAEKLTINGGEFYPKQGYFSQTDLTTNIYDVSAGELILNGGKVNSDGVTRVYCAVCEVKDCDITFGESYFEDKLGAKSAEQLEGLLDYGMCYWTYEGDRFSPESKLVRVPTPLTSGVLTGGCFVKSVDYDPDSIEGDYVAEVTYVDNVDGKTVFTTTPVIYPYDLNYAFHDPRVKTIKLLKDITLESEQRSSGQYVTIGYYGDITIDLNGHELYFENKSLVVEGDVTIIDSSASGDGQLWVEMLGISVFGDSPIGRLTVKSGNVLTMEMYIFGESEFVLAGGTVTAYRTAEVAYYAEMTIAGGVFSGPIAVGEDGSFNMTGGSIKSSFDGPSYVRAEVQAENYSTVNISGGYIENLYDASDYRDGIPAVITLSGGEFGYIALDDYSNYYYLIELLAPGCAFFNVGDGELFYAYDEYVTEDVEVKAHICEVDDGDECGCGRSSEIVIGEETEDTLAVLEGDIVSASPDRIKIYIDSYVDLFAALTQGMYIVSNGSASSGYACVVNKITLLADIEPNVFDDEINIAVLDATLDLNGHKFAPHGQDGDLLDLRLEEPGLTFTVTDSSKEKDGVLEVDGIYVDIRNTLKLAGGDIHTYGYASIVRGNIIVRGGDLIYKGADEEACLYSIDGKITLAKGEISIPIFMTADTEYFMLTDETGEPTEKEPEEEPIDETTALETADDLLVTGGTLSSTVSLYNDTSASIKGGKISRLDLSMAKAEISGGEIEMLNVLEADLKISGGKFGTIWSETKTLAEFLDTGYAFYQKKNESAKKYTELVKANLKLLNDTIVKTHACLFDEDGACECGKLGRAGASSIMYLDKNGEEKYLGAGEYKYLSGTKGDLTLDGGWYVVDGDTKVGGSVILNGSVNILLTDDSKLTVGKGILDSYAVAPINHAFTASLGIYAQSLREADDDDATQTASETSSQSHVGVLEVGSCFGGFGQFGIAVKKLVINGGDIKVAIDDLGESNDPYYGNNGEYVYGILTDSGYEQNAGDCTIEFADMDISGEGYTYMGLQGLYVNAGTLDLVGGSLKVDIGDLEIDDAEYVYVYGIVNNNGLFKLDGTVVDVTVGDIDISSKVEPYGALTYVNGICTMAAELNGKLSSTVGNVSYINNSRYDGYDGVATGYALFTYGSSKIGEDADVTLSVGEVSYEPKEDAETYSAALFSGDMSMTGGELKLASSDWHLYVGDYSSDVGSNINVTGGSIKSTDRTDGAIAVWVYDTLTASSKAFTLCADSSMRRFRIGDGLGFKDFLADGYSYFNFQTDTDISDEELESSDVLFYVYVDKTPCKHEHIDTRTYYCRDCEKYMLAEVDGRYFYDFGKALGYYGALLDSMSPAPYSVDESDEEDYPVLKLLRDVVYDEVDPYGDYDYIRGVYIHFNNTYTDYKIDLNGHTLSTGGENLVIAGAVELIGDGELNAIGDRDEGMIRVYGYLTIGEDVFVNGIVSAKQTFSSDGFTQYRNGKIVINGGSVGYVHDGEAVGGVEMISGEIVITDGYVSKLVIRDGSEVVGSISGGRFDSFEEYNGDPLELLADGYLYFTKGISGEYDKIAHAEYYEEDDLASVTDVKVLPHTCEFNKDGKCICGERVVASLTLIDEDGNKTTTLYSDIDKAFVAMNQQTAELTLLTDVTSVEYVLPYAKATIDFNGHKLTTDSSDYFRIPDGSRYSYTFKDSVGGGGLGKNLERIGNSTSLAILSGDYEALELSYSNKVTLSSGSFKSISVYDPTDILADGHIYMNATGPILPEDADSSYLLENVHVELCTHPETDPDTNECLYCGADTRPDADYSWYVGHESDMIYTIYTAEQLLGFANIVNGTADGIERFNFSGRTVKLGSDIDLLFDGALYNWAPIGTNMSDPFLGTFDGQNKTIGYLYIDYYNEYAGLFGVLGNTVVEDAIIKDLTLTNGSVNDRGGYPTGSVCGWNNGTIMGVKNECDVSSDGGAVGGITGGGDHGKVLRCSNYGHVVSRGGSAGGIVGATNDMEIVDSYNAGEVEAVRNNDGISGSAGGIVGYMSWTYASRSDKIVNCYNSGKVSADDSDAAVMYALDDAAETVPGIAGAIIGELDVTSYYDNIIPFELKHCYYLEANDTARNWVGNIIVADTRCVDIEVPEKTGLDVFRSGKITSELQNYTTNNTYMRPLWGQKLGEEDFPVHSTDEVFCVTFECWIIEGGTPRRFTHAEAYANAGKTVKLPPEPNDFEGKYFARWIYDSNQVFTSNTVVNSDMTVEATYLDHLNAVVTVETKTYDGTVKATVSATVPGKDITITGLKGSFVTKDVGENKQVILDSSDVVVTGTDANRYVVRFPRSAFGNIERCDISQATVKLARSSFAYDGTVPTPVVRDVKLGTKSIYDDLTYDVSETSTSGKNAGSYKLKIDGTGNYKGTAEVEWTITPAKIVIKGGTFKAQDRAYIPNDNTVNVVCTGYEYTDYANVEGDEYTVDFTKGGVMADANVGKNKPVTTAFTVSGPSAANYVVEQVTGLTVNITKAEPVERTKTTATVKPGDKLSTASVDAGLIVGVDGRALPGELTWLNGNKVIDNNTTAEMLFTPDDENYETLKISVDVKLNTGNGSNSGFGIALIRYTVKFDTNGGSKLDDVKVKRNSKLPEPEEPTKDGFEFAGWFIDEELTEEYDFDTPVKNSFTLYAAWERDGSGKLQENELPFDDVKPNAWHREYIRRVYEEGIMNGVGNRTFAPDGLITRGMFITVLYRLEGSPEVEGDMPFGDVHESDYFYDAVLWGYQSGVVKGISETEYSPDTPILREQITAMMFRYANYKEYDVSEGEDTNILSYADYDKISEYAIESMQYAVGIGLINGKTESTLAPADYATRAEIAAIITRFLDYNAFLD